MRNWKKTKLGDTATFINGYAFKPTQWTESGREIIRIQNLTGSSSTTNYFDGEIKEKYLVRGGDLLISWSATLGVYEWSREDAWLNQHIFKVVFDKEEVDKIFFRYLIQRSLGVMESQVHGATMKHITKKRFDALPVNLPPLPTQTRIARALDLADRHRRLLREELDAYDRLGESLFLEMFGDPVRNEKQWKIEPFSYFAVFDTKMVSDFEKYGDLPHIGIRNIEKGSGKLIDFVTAKEDGVISGKYLFDESHIIYSKIRPSLNKVAMPTFKGVCSADAYPLLVRKERTNREFLSTILKNRCFLDFIASHSLRTNIPKANKKQMMKFNCIAPSLPLQTEFASRIKKINLLKAKTQATLKEADDLFNALLQRAFRGELFVE
jgi:type I restriction enzyme S subunit